MKEYAKLDTLWTAVGTLMLMLLCAMLAKAVAELVKWLRHGIDPYSHRAFLAPDARSDSVKWEYHAGVLRCWEKKRWLQFLVCFVFGPCLTWL